ncbi:MULTISPECIES: DUF3948 family protein, partial [Bacillus cereus group]
SGAVVLTALIVFLSSVLV